MSTTSLFVELLVIGSGAFTALALLVLVVAERITGWALSKSAIELISGLDLLVAALLLSFIYLLGILIDRLADYLLDRFSVRDEYFDTASDFHSARIDVYTKFESVRRIHEEYTLGRLRVCRAWTVNSCLLLLTTIIFAFLKIGLHAQMRIALAAAALLLWGSLAVGCFLAWRRLNTTYHAVMFNAFRLARCPDSLKDWTRDRFKEKEERLKGDLPK